MPWFSAVGAKRYRTEEHPVSVMGIDLVRLRCVRESSRDRQTASC
jgi:hypothetical protein